MEVIVIYVILRMAGKIKQDCTDEMLYVKVYRSKSQTFWFQDLFILLKISGTPKSFCLCGLNLDIYDIQC